MKRAIIYTRVSTDEQADRGYSLRDQQAKLERFCMDKGYEIVRHFQDDASAKTFNRPEFNKLMEFVKKNKGCAEKLLFIKWDRFSRNMLEGMLMKQTLKKYGISAEATEQPLDDEIPENLLMEAIYLAAPQVENTRRSLNTKAGMRKAMREGRWVSTPPKGYKMGRDAMNKPIMVKTADADFIKQAFELYSTGLYSKNEVRGMLTKKGFKICKNQFCNLLRNPLYYGKIFIPEYKDEEAILVNGIHEAIIEEDLFMKCQRIEFGTKKNMPKPNAKNEMLPLRGNLICKDCGGTLTGSGSKGNGGKYFYYHCQHGCKERFRAEDAHSSFQDYISSLEIKPEIASLYLAVMEDIFIAEEGDRKKELKKLEEEIIAFRNKLITTDDKFISGDLEKDSYKRMKDHYHQEIWKLQEKKNDIESMDSAFIQYTKWGFSLLLNLPEYYNGASLEIKQKIIGSIFPEKLVFSEGAYRTNKPNEVLTLLCNNINGLGGNKKGQTFISDSLPSGAPPLGLEPRTP